MCLTMFSSLTSPPSRSCLFSVKLKSVRTTQGFPLQVEHSSTTMNEVQSPVSVQLQNEVNLLQPHVQLLFLQLLQHLRANQSADIWVELNREKQDRLQAVAELHDRIDKGTEMVTNMEHTQRTERQKDNARMRKLIEAMRAELRSALDLKKQHGSLNSSGNEWASDEDVIGNEGTAEGGKRRALDYGSETQTESASEISEEEAIQKTTTVSESEGILEAEILMNDQEGSVKDIPSAQDMVELLKKEKIKVQETVAYIKKLEAEKQNCSQNLHSYRERILKDEILFLELRYDVSMRSHKTHLDALNQQLDQMATEVNQIRNASLWQHVKRIKTLVQETGLEIVKCSSTLENRTRDLDYVTHVLQIMKTNFSLLQKQLEAKGVEVTNLEKENSRLVAQKHDIEKMNAILEHRMVEFKLDLDKCLPIAKQLPNEKALVLNLKALNQNCTTSLVQKIHDVSELSTELSTQKMNVKNLSSVVHNLTNKVEQVNQTAESKWKERIHTTANLLRHTTVLEAVKAGDLAVTQFLVEAGKPVNTRDAANLGRTPLHWAAREGYLQVAELLLRSGALLETKSNAGYTPLHEAAYNGHTDLCRLLLDNGAEVDSLNKFNNTPLHWAASNNHLATVQLLVHRGANCNANNDGGRTPMFLADGYGHTAVTNWLRFGCGKSS